MSTDLPTLLLYLYILFFSCHYYNFLCELLKIEITTIIFFLLAYLLVVIYLTDGILNTIHKGKISNLRVLTYSCDPDWTRTNDRQLSLPQYVTIPTFLCCSLDYIFTISGGVRIVSTESLVSEFPRCCPEN